MNRLTTLLVTAAALVSTAALADDFPAGGEHDFVAKTCTQCHDANTVTSQHLTPALWASTIDRMKGNGAVIPDAEIDKLVAYLSQHFGTGTPAAAAPAPAAGGARAAGGGAALTPAQRARDPMALAQYPVIEYQQVEGKPIDTRWPEKQDDAPTFPGQTRAPYHASVPYTTTVITAKLVRPWAVDFLPDGKYIVTQRLGTMVIVDQQGNISKPISGVPTVSDPGTQAGLLDVELDPKFASNHRLFLTYNRPSGPQSGPGLDRAGAQDAIAVASATLDEAGLALNDVKVIFIAKPAVANELSMSKIGSRIAFAKDGSLFVSVGDRDPISLPMPSPIMLAQHLNNTLGKIVHITPDGKPAADNPFLKTKQAQPEIWSYGIRSPEGIAIDAKGQLWFTDEQQRGGSEVNLAKKGGNFGWPLATHGMDYTGNLINDGITHIDGMEDPRYYWDPAMAPSGMAFYNADLFPAWKGSLLVSTLRGSILSRLTISKDNKITSEEPLLVELKQRLRDVKVGPDGAVYVVTDRDSLLKLTPK